MIGFAKILVWNHLFRAASFAAFAILFAATSFAQSDASDNIFPGRNRNNQEDQPKNVKEYLAKQRTEKAKKDHEELLKRGDELVALTDQLESAFQKSNQLTPADRVKLESVEKLVTRIRKGLGGDGDEEEGAEAASPDDEERAPNSVKEAFIALKERTTKLVDELKKTSRFTISALAIQSSNSLLKVVRFLRLRK